MNLVFNNLSVRLCQTNLSEAVGENPSEQPGLPTRAEEETLSLLIVENNENANDKNQSDSTDNLSDGKHKQRERGMSEHTRSVLSLNYNQNIHPTS